MSHHELFIPKLPEGYSLRIPTSHEASIEMAKGVDLVYVYNHYFISGLVLLKSPIIIDFLRLANFAPCQLLQNAYKTLFVIFRMFESIWASLVVKSLAALYIPTQTLEKFFLRGMR